MYDKAAPVGVHMVNMCKIVIEISSHYFAKCISLIHFKPISMLWIISGVDLDSLTRGGGGWVKQYHIRHQPTIHQVLDPCYVSPSVHTGVD